ncbi:peptidase domain-containing ABC transporter [Candidatus Clostridium radicumherbarum]|uniref:Peptidase domain-containing ABC transporter n=1 Tax=Candidatus Clostridium radicumherbarum TaxID=3381662 RepID=A0ABW8TQY4_9CLOT
MGKISSLLKLKPFIKKYKTIFWTGIIGIILSSIIANPVPYLIGKILDNVLKSKNSFNMLYYNVLIIAILYILRYIFSIVSKYMFVKINNLVVNEMRILIMGKVIDLPMSYLSVTEKGYVQGRISECTSIGSIFSPSVISILLSIIDAILALVVMFTINYKLAIVVLVMTPIFYLSSKTSANSLMKSTHEMLESGAVLNGECFEIINGVEEIKTLNGKSTHLNKFKNKLNELVQSSIKQSKSILLFMENIGLINNLGSLLILLISGIMIVNGQFTIGLYTSFSLYILKVFGSIQGIATVGTTIKPVCLSIERIYELLDMEDENSGRSKQLNNEIESIELNNLTFRYKSDSKDVLKKLNVKINKGNKVLIKGENGSGKSTLIKLLLGLYKPTGGQILYNKIDSCLINVKNIREKISVVSQNVFLFRGTVLDNILYGQSEKNIEDVEKIIRELNLYDYINKLPMGLNTEINQNTSGVSGGQAQVIAFIRAMLSKKDVIILDEPISNVDVETREIISNILKNIKFKGILIIVSHITIDVDDYIDKIIEI